MTKIKLFLIIFLNWWRHSFDDLDDAFVSSLLLLLLLLLLLVPYGQHGPYGLVTDCLHLVLSSVIDAASLRSLSHHFKMSSIYLRAGRPGRRSPSTIPNNYVFNSRASDSDILQICPYGWSFLVRIVSTTVSFPCTDQAVCDVPERQQFSTRPPVSVQITPLDGNDCAQSTGWLVGCRRW